MRCPARIFQPGERCRPGTYLSPDVSAGQVLSRLYWPQKFASMKQLLLAVCFAVIPVLHLAGAQGKPATPAAPVAPAVSHAPAAPVFGAAEQNALVKQYCVTC